MAQSLLDPDDEADGGCLLLLLGDLVHGGSLVRDPDDAVVHVGVGLAGVRGDQRGKSFAVCPIIVSGGRRY